MLKRIMMLKRIKKPAFKQILVYFLLAIVVFISTFPFIWAFLSSLKPNKELLAFPPTIIPQEFVLTHYINLHTLTHYETYMLNSAVTATCVTILTLTISVIGAYGLTRFKFRGRKQIAQLTLLTYMFPRILLGLPLFLLFAQYRLLNTFYGLVLAQITITVPFILWLLWGFFRQIPPEYEEAAMVDGATRLQAIWKVVLPSALPGIIASGVFAFIFSWNDYLMALLLISSDKLKTVPLATALLFSYETIEWGMMMSAAVIVTLPVLIGFVYIKKYLEKGFVVA